MASVLRVIRNLWDNEKVLTLDLNRLSIRASGLEYADTNVWKI